MLGLILKYIVYNIQYITYSILTLSAEERHHDTQIDSQYKLKVDDKYSVQADTFNMPISYQ